jgi:hypothetical protein
MSTISFTELITLSKFSGSVCQKVGHLLFLISLKSAKVQNKIQTNE